MIGSFSGIFTTTAEAPRFVLIGAPHDAGSSFRPGARLGPQAIRHMASSLSAADERGEDLRGLGVDLGDLLLAPTPEQAWTSIEAAVGDAADRGAVPIVLGGDHAVTVPAFTAVRQRHGDVRFLCFDAHPDLYPEYDGDRRSHACVTRRILELPGMDGRRITQVGIRASNPMQRAVAEEEGLRTVHAWEADGFRYTESGPVYVSVDIDVLDPAHAPGCGNPVPGGLTTRQLFAALAALDAEIVGFDVVEVNPLLDAAGITALAGARVVTELVGAIVRRG